MKKLLSLFFVLAVVGTTFVSCDKDDDETPVTNSVTITGTFTVGDKTYTSPTFDLGSPENHKGYIEEMITKGEKRVSPLVISQVDDSISLGEGYSIRYKFFINSIVVGQTNGYARIVVYDKAENEAYLTSSECAFNITAIGNVGEYIEGTYEGTFAELEPLKGSVTYPVKGIFKVKRVEAPDFD